MAQYLKNKKKIDLIFEKGSTVKGRGLLMKTYDFKDGFVHTANLVTGNFDKIPSTSRNGKMADCVRERAEGSKMLFMKEVSDLGYNVPEEYLFKKTAADHVAEKASWIEKAIDYKPQEKKVGPFKFKW